ncbi:MAG: Acetyltransferase Pat [Syntrophus sp. PtaU1.Bin208]|nr:MAG: Acetyltransferase Pat [Syntrophus sp. PtaU1.Bin208]
MGHIRTMFNPKTIALIGASEKPDAVSRTILKNLLNSKKRRIYPVNPGREFLMEVKCYPTISAVPEHVDLAIIAIPARSVPQAMEECGQAGVDGVVIVSAGFREIGEEGKRLENEIDRIGRQYGMRVLGPNCVGFVRPSIDLRVTLLEKTPPPGDIAFISQSAALGSAILDWAADAGIGFSMFVSFGDMIDIDFADMIDFLEEYDETTRSVLVYMESVGNARKFMSAARGFARRKPIIVLKPGRSVESARAVQSHTGSMAGDDEVYSAAFRRAGILRVEEIVELFDAAKVLESRKLPEGPRVAIVGSAGLSVMATDSVIKRGGELAALSPESTGRLHAVLPPYWNKTNPVYLRGGATVDQYINALNICVKDKAVDGVLVNYVPLNSASSADVARAVVDIAGKTGKPVIATWMGGKDILEGKRIFLEHGIPIYNTPEEAVRGYMNMYSYKRYLDRLYETPAELPGQEAPPKDRLRELLRDALAEGRTLLNEQESKEFLAVYGIPVTMPQIVQNQEEAAAIAEKLGYPVAIKIVSPDISHKSEAGGVMLGIDSSGELEDAYAKLIRKVNSCAPFALVNGVAVEKMMLDVDYEIILGAKKDKDFGSVILFGTGGTMAEAIRDYSIGLPPLNKSLANLLMQDTKAYKMLQGFRGRHAADLVRLEEILVNFSNLIVDFPEIAEIDVNPLAVAAGNVSALDARIVIDRDYLPNSSSSYPHLAICPYPTKYIQTWQMKSGREVILRPVRPEDEPAKYEMFFSSSPESLRTRFFSTLKEIPHKFLIHFVNVDYDRNISLVAEIEENKRKRMIGSASLVMNTEMTSGELAVFVHDSFQGTGLGPKFIQVLMDIAREKSLPEIRAEVLRENVRMLAIFRRFGFATRHFHGDAVECRLKLT